MNSVRLVLCVVFFFFKQKTAYEMRISDWSSDVCSSDLPLFFGILVALNLQTAFLTPPMAMSAYYLKGIAPGHMTLVQIFNGSLPYLLLVIVAMVILYNVPQLAHWLPGLMYG